MPARRVASQIGDLMSEERPNILVIMTDQQRFDTLGINGNPVIRTPALDQLARDGVNLTNVFVQSPMCTPSRAAFATGRYPSVNGASWNGNGLALTERTFMQELADHGYQTALFGKLHLLPHTTRRPDDPTFGFQTAVIAENGRPVQVSAYSEWLRANWPEHYQPSRTKVYDETLQTYVSGRPAAAHFTTWAANETIAYLESRPAAPFFATMSVYDPHHPFDPPEPYAAMYDPAQVPLPPYHPGELDDKPPHFRAGREGRVNLIMGLVDEPPKGGPDLVRKDLREVPEATWRQIVAHYYGMVSLIDDQVGRVLTTLAATGLAENTVVLFTSDHGELLGDHGLLFKGPHHYDALLRVPAIMRWPGVLPAGRVVDGLVELIDLPATILALAGVAPPPGMQGRSIVPLLMGETDQGRESVLVERQDAYWNLDLRTLRTRDRKLTVYAGESYGELYDLVADPGEIHNRWDDPAYAEDKQRLLHQLLSRVIEAADPLPERTAIV